MNFVLVYGQGLLDQGLAFGCQFGLCPQVLFGGLKLFIGDKPFAMDRPRLRKLNIRYIVNTTPRLMSGGVANFFEKERELKAVASASHILVGHQRPVTPVMLDFVVEPSVAKRRLRLKLVQSNFRIAPDQYEVVGPETIDVPGGFKSTTRRRVYETIVTKLAEQRELVEEKIRELVPTLITEMEQRLEFADSSDLFRSLWPLPIYQPRVRLWPEAVVVEKSGLSIAIGMAVAAPSTMALS